MKNFFRLLGACTMLVLAACSIPWQGTVPITKDTQLTLGGVDHINPLSMDTTGAVLFLKQQQSDGTEVTQVLGQPSIVHQRGLVGVVVEQGTGAVAGGWFYFLGQQARRPAQISVGGSSSTATSTGGAGGTASTGGIGLNVNANSNASATGGNAQQSQGQGQGLTTNGGIPCGGLSSC